MISIPTTTSLETALAEKIRARAAQIAVIGIGYVGLPLATAFAQAGFPTIGLDLDARKVDLINRGESYIPDVETSIIRALVEEKRLRASTDDHILHDADVIFICVPTPFDRMKAPDLAAIRGASESIARNLKPGQMVILQSTTYPGTTEEFVLPILETSGLKAGEDFYLAFSPERIDPGNKQWSAANMPKVLGGLTPHSTELARDLLATLTPHVHLVSTPRAAEMTKLLENIFRSVNIALVNELALLCERMDIDIWEVIEAAKTKPFGYMPFYPSAGVGGHCIPVDPYYLSWKAREYDFYTKFIELAAEVNQSMPFHVVNLIGEALNHSGKSFEGANVLVLGVAFKRDIDDARNSPAERIIELLLSRRANVSYHDPYVPHFHIGDSVFHRQGLVLEGVLLTPETVRAADVIVIVTGHRNVDYGMVLANARRVVDTTSITSGLPHDGKVVRLGASQNIRPSETGANGAG
ncbi:MAG TPA: nucleotide sugar dehydrogenase [Anaerolineae bacterium]|nr:nucleotide sugar dehydrogenase [Anaerolineae bacterium]